MQISFAVVRDGNASRLFVGQLISQTCDKMMSVGLVWMFAERYPAIVIPWFLGVSALPHLLLAWHAGQWAARFGQIRTLWATDLCRGVVIMGLALAWAGLGQQAELYALFAASFIANMASALFNPAILSSPITLTGEELVQQLTALIESCFSIGNVVGPLLTALLYPWLGLRGLFILNSLSYLLAAALEFGIRARTAVAEEEPPPASTTAQVLKEDGLVTVMLGGFLASNLFLAPIMVIMPLFVRACYGGRLETLAGLETCFGIGTIVGGLFLSTVRIESHMGRKMTVGMVCVALAYLGFAFSQAPWMGDLSLVGLGFFLATTNVLSMTIFQQRIQAQNVPTLMSLVNLIGVASLPVSMAVVGFAVGHFDIRVIAIACAAGLSLATAAVTARRDFRAL